MLENKIISMTRLTLSKLCLVLRKYLSGRQDPDSIRPDLLSRLFRPGKNFSSTLPGKYFFTFEQVNP
jgi:hypothetical protein